MTISIRHAGPFFALLFALGCAEETDLCDEGFGEDDNGECQPLDEMDSGPGDRDSGPRSDGGEDATTGDAGDGCDDVCEGTTPFCVDTSCVECRDSDDCMNVNDARCVMGSCEQCTGNDECAKFSGLTRCEEDLDPNECVECIDDSTCTGATPACDTDSNTCVPCTPASQGRDCTGACDPRTNMCSIHAPGTRELCEECQSDDDCMGADRFCVEVAYEDMGSGMTFPEGGRCLAIQGARCPDGTFNEMPDTSIGGSAGVMSGTFCFPQPDTSCSAIRDFVDGLCTDASMCGLGQGDGICSGGACTTPCARVRDCYESAPCSGGECG